MTWLMISKMRFLRQMWDKPMMFSNDDNVEKIGKLAETLKHYIGLQTEYTKLDVIEKIVRVITAITLISVLAVSLLLITVFLSIAAANALAPSIGLAWGYAVVAAIHFVVFLLLLVFRKQWIERPVVKFLASILFGNEA